MSSLQSLREFISERLAAAAEEIFKHCEGTIVQYEQELCRQRRLLDICWKPQLQLHDIAFSQHDASEKENIYNQQGISSIQQDEQGFPQIKEQQSEPELQHIKEEWTELEPTQIKEEQGQQEPRPIKEEHRERKSPQMKEEQEGLCIIHVEEQLGAPTYKENGYSEEDLNN